MHKMKSIDPFYNSLLNLLKESNIYNRPLMTYAAIWLIFVFGLIGFITSLVCLNAGSIPSKGIRVVYPYPSVIWVTSLIMFYSFSSLLLIHSKRTLSYMNNGNPLLKCCLKFSNYYWSYYYYNITLFSMLLVLGYFLAYNNGAGLWSILLTMLSILNIIIHKQFSESLCPIVIDNSVDVEHNHTVNKIIDDNNMVDLKVSLTDNGISKEYDKKPSSYYLTTFGIALYCCLRVVAFLITGLLLGGAYLQANGYRTYKPEGTFVFITYPNGYKQKILTQCVGTRNPAVPTIWVEVGGGGHSMSDLWGLRDYIQTNYGRRYCSYDMPGTGWSDPAVTLQPLITSQVIQAINEPGPFICLGTMDDGDVRCLKFCVANPSMCSAVVPVAFGSPSEFQLYCNYYGCSYNEQIALMKKTCGQRMVFGNLINFFAVGWGLVNSIITNPNYVPSSLARASLFLNVLNEKQWSTNTNILYECSLNPANPELTGFVGNSSWVDPAYTLPASIPIFGFTLGQTQAQLNQQCSNYGYAIGSKDCGYLNYIYNETITVDKQIIQNSANTSSTLFICTDACTDANGNTFLIDQESMIPWFATTLFSAIQGIKT